MKVDGKSHFYAQKFQLFNLFFDKTSPVLNYAIVLFITAVHDPRNVYIYIH